MNGVNLEPERFGQFGKDRRAGGGSLDGQVAEHVATAGVVVMMSAARLILGVG